MPLPLSSTPCPFWRTLGSAEPGRILFLLFRRPFFCLLDRRLGTELGFASFGGSGPSAVP
eukprot:9108359-Prorocentrum_lima.AAC.1